jgi:hypothetical protein
MFIPSILSKIWWKLKKKKKKKKKKNDKYANKDIKQINGVRIIRMKVN